MKKALLLLLLIIPYQFSGQNYKLINASSKKLFITWPDSLFTYSLSIDSAKAAGPDSVYYNFFGLNPEIIESDTCDFWLGNYCQQQNYPVWSGPLIKYDNSENYLFFNLRNDSLDFHFSTTADSSIKFFEDSIQVFSILYEKTDTLTILGQLDSARFFKIIHSDTAGNPVDSPLNGKDIIIAKNLGLTSFFTVDSFPEVLKPLRLIGDETQNAGLYKLTNEIIYDYHPDDEIQIDDWVYYEPGSHPPWDNYTRYTKLTILNRTDLEDSIIYRAQRTYFYLDSTDIFNDTITLKYPRSKIIARIPFEKYDGQEKKLFIDNYCDTPHWTYTVSFVDGPEYCAADNCWGGKDTFGPPVHRFKKFIQGVGLVYKEEWNDFPGYTYSIGNRIVYTKLQGKVCGKEVIAGVNSYVVPETQIVLSPNPSSSTVHISSPLTITRLVLFNVTGGKILSGEPNGKQTLIDVNSYPEGLYFVRIWLANKQVIVKKLILSGR
ncbi:MAG: T9SS type A sorting domain-containing protein [Chlorobi bacterium]|nr:T9SS type A sorting domain-containing protein [Chlorobiota bacterium]